MFRSLRTYSLPKQLYHFAFRPQCIWVPVVPYPHQQLTVWNFWILVILLCMQWCKFPNDKWCWIYFHTFVCPLYIFLRDAGELKRGGRRAQRWCPLAFVPRDYFSRPLDMVKLDVCLSGQCCGKIKWASFAQSLGAFWSADSALASGSEESLCRNALIVSEFAIACGLMGASPIGFQS